MTKESVLVHLHPLANVGGCEISSLRLVEALPHHRHLIVVLGTPGVISDHWQAVGADVIHLNILQFSSRRFGRELGAWWQQAGPKRARIIYWSTVRLPIVLSALHGRFEGCCVHLGNPVPVGIRQRLRLLLYEMFWRCPDNVVLAACSQQVAMSCRQAPYYRRMPVHVVYGPMQMDVRLVPQRTRLYGQIVGMAARMDHIKDHATLIRGFALVVQQKPDARLELTGEGETRAAMETLANSLGLGQAIHFLGFVSDLQERMQKWGVYVHSTTAREGMGSALVEAMGAGLPCLVSDLPVMREVCGDHGAAYFRAADHSDLAGKLLDLLGDATRREVLSNNARQRAETLFGATRVAERYLALLTGNESGGRPVVASPD